MCGFGQLQDPQPAVDEGAGARGYDGPRGGEAVEGAEELAGSGNFDGVVAVFEGELAFEFADVCDGMGLVGEVGF